MLANIQPTNAGGYTVIVTNTSGRATSDVATVTVGEQPRLACGGAGRATAQTGQVDLTLSGDVAGIDQSVAGLTAPLGPLGAVVAGVSSSVISGTLTAKAHVSAAVCGLRGDSASWPAAEVGDSYSRSNSRRSMVAAR